MNGTPLQTAMTNLQAGWYNALCAALNLPTSGFQLMAGEGSPIGTDLQQAWLIADTVPALSIVTDYSGSRSLFSSGYGDLLGDLQDPSESTFQTEMGDYYDVWQSYVSTYKWQPNDSTESVFRTWAMTQGWPTNRVTSLISAMDYSMPVSNAQTTFNNATGTNKGYAYNFTLDDITDALRVAPGPSIDVECSSAATAFSGTYAAGAVGGWWDIFGGDAESSYSSTSLAVANAGLVIKGSYTHACQFTVSPLSSVSDDPILSTYTPWYDSSLLAKAYANQDNHDEIWNLEADGDWNDYFDPTKGQLARAATQLVIVDGLDFTITSTVSLSSADASTIQSEASGGFFPFFAIESSSTHDVSVTQADAGGLKITVHRDPGAPLVLGVVVEPASSYVG